MIPSEQEQAHAKTERTIRALNRCIEECTDGEKLYAIASADAREPTLKAVFRSYEQQRADFVAAIQMTIDSLGARHENEGTLRGTLHRGWTGARLALEGRNDEVIVDECMRAEKSALRVYDHILRDSGEMPSHVRALLTNQRVAIASAHIDMRNRLAFPHRNEPSPRPVERREHALRGRARRRPPAPTA